MMNDSAAPRTSIKVFLIAFGDRGRVGKEIGCGDSVVPVLFTIPATQTPLRAAVEHLLTTSAELPEDFDVAEEPSGAQLYNPLYRSHLAVESVSIDKGAAVIRLSGELVVNGVCDAPRFQAQFEETALQFPTVNRVSVFINDVPLEDILSEDGDLEGDEAGEA